MVDIADGVAVKKAPIIVKNVNQIVLFNFASSHFHLCNLEYKEYMSAKTEIFNLEFTH